MPWLKACSADLAAGTCAGAVVNGVEIAVYNVDGEFHATSNICTHQLAYLTDGYLEGDMIECPLHQGRFNVRTGAPEGPPVYEPIRVYPVRVEGADVLVEVDPA